MKIELWDRNRKFADKLIGNTEKILLNEFTDSENEDKEKTVKLNYENKSAGFFKFSVLYKRTETTLKKEDLLYASDIINRTTKFKKLTK